jgi:hypothetical protein
MSNVFTCITMENTTVIRETWYYFGDTIPPKVLGEFHTEGLQKDVIGVMKHLDKVPFFILLLRFW